jgi:hypothetical protein
MLMALRIGLARPGRDIASDRAIDGSLGWDHLEVLNAPSSCEMSGRDVRFVSSFYGAAGRMGEARGTTMVKMKSTIATDVSSAL